MGDVLDGDLKTVSEECLQEVITGVVNGILLAHLMGDVIGDLKGIIISDLKGVLKATSSKYLNRPKNHS